MSTIVLPPKRTKIGIGADIENLEKRVKLFKEWLSKAEAELESLREEYENIKCSD